MRYLCLLYVAEDTAPAPGTPAFGEVVAANVSARDAMTGPVCLWTAPLCNR